MEKKVQQNVPLWYPYKLVTFRTGRWSIIGTDDAPFNWSATRTGESSGNIDGLYDPRLMRALSSDSPALAVMRYGETKIRNSSTVRRYNSDS